jgi:hypothetical protein
MQIAKAAPKMRTSARTTFPRVMSRRFAFNNARPRLNKTAAKTMAAVSA